MKKIIGMLAICASFLVAPVFAQTPAPAQTPAAGQTPAAQPGCTEEAKTAVYTEFTAMRTTAPPKAYESAKKYLACSQQEDQYTAYLKKWTAAYEKDFRKLKFQPLLYGDKKYAEAFALGKEILAEEPENLRVIIDLGYSGFHLAAPTTKDDKFNQDSLTYARKAIQMIEAGKTPDKWDPFKGKDDTLAYLYHAVGRLTFKSNPSEALTALIKALNYETDLKKEPWEYFFVAAAYETGPYPKLSADYKARFEDKPESPEQKLALANIEQIIDRMIDAYARAVALAGNNPKYATNKNEWMEALTTWYKYRHNQSDTGLTEMIAGIMSKPLPPEPTPITSLPTTTPTTTTTTPTSGAVNSSGDGASAAAAGSSSTTPKTTTTTSSAVPNKPKPKNNHRRR